MMEMLAEMSRLQLIFHMTINNELTHEKTMHLNPFNFAFFSQQNKIDFFSWIKFIQMTVYCLKFDCVASVTEDWCAIHSIYIYGNLNKNVN